MNRNISGIEQGVSFALGALLLLATVRSRSRVPVRAATGALGAAFLTRGSTGHCPLFGKLGIDSRNGLKAFAYQEHTLLINLRLDEVEAALAARDLPLSHLRPEHLRLSTADDGRRTRLEALPSAVPALVELRRLKAFLETGEIPTVLGQSTGRRSLVGKGVAAFLPSAKENAVRVGLEPLKVKAPRRMADGGLEVRV